jgi:hypothetical protein
VADSFKDNDSPIEQKAKMLSVGNRLPSIKFLSILVSALIAFIFFVYPAFKIDKSSWSSGKLSNHHKLLEKNCAACHDSAFSEVKDKTCLNCHNQNSFGNSSHSKFIAEHSNLNKSCISCHFEHKANTSIISNDNRLCVDCHSNIKDIKNDSELKNVSDFANHPEIKLPQDKGLLKLNHAVHLKKDLKTIDGVVTLGCSDCHKLSSDEKSFLPITYENSCKSCHLLSFDEQIPDVQAPHGDSDAVVNFIFGIYSKLAVVGAHTESTKGIEALKNPTTSKPTFYSQDKVIADTRETEKLIFTKTGCALCHTINEKSKDLPTSDIVTLQSNYEVVKPNTPHIWLAKAIFNHGSHATMKCDSCHSNVLKSEDSKELLIPDIKNCKECHAGAVSTYDLKHSGLNSNCVTCHVYHNAQLDAISTASALSNILRGKK